MAHRIEVGFLPEIFDAPGARTAKKVREAFGYDIEQIRIVYVYTIDKDLTREQLEAIASGPFSDPLVQRYAIDEPLAGEFDWAVEVGFLPGVTDNVGRTAREAIEHLGIRFADGEAVYTAQQYRFKAGLDRTQVERIARELLANELIQRFDILSYDEWKARGGFKLYVPKVVIPHEPRVEAIDLELSDEELANLSRSRVLALSVEEMKAIRDYYRRPEVQRIRREYGLPPDKPTDVELECLAQTWSEHCKHKIFNAYITYRDDETKEVEEIDSLFKT
ncbi:MAG TPA: phosphoribosylformylglycinamidine synthase, partial [Proteobacteria bacterium]|nr:phosphoribosylformylglycinamidine synthase [Pseudomonadota bacterium]